MKRFNPKGLVFWAAAAATAACYTIGSVRGCWAFGALTALVLMFG